MVECRTIGDGGGGNDAGISGGIGGGDTIPVPSQTTAELAAAVLALDAGVVWTCRAAIALQFAAHHPQGLVRYRDLWWMTTVDTEKPRGHLLGFDVDGELCHDIELGDSVRSHPGGFDVMGGAAFVPVGECRPDSTSGIWRVDLTTLEAEELYRLDDHVGALAYIDDESGYVAMTWGSRDILTVSADGQITGRRRNPCRFFDVQDNQLLGDKYLLCSGVSYPPSSNGQHGIGGVGLLDIEQLSWLHEVPILEQTPGGRVITYNPVWCDVDAAGSLRLHVVPDDGQSTLYTYCTR